VVLRRAAIPVVQLAVKNLRRAPRPGHALHRAAMSRAPASLHMWHASAQESHIRGNGLNSHMRPVRRAAATRAAGDGGLQNTCCHRRMRGLLV